MQKVRNFEFRNPPTHLLAQVIDPVVHPECEVRSLLLLLPALTCEVVVVRLVVTHLTLGHRGADGGC